MFQRGGFQGNLPIRPGIQNAFGVLDKALRCTREETIARISTPQDVETRQQPAISMASVYVINFLMRPLSAYLGLSSLPLCSSRLASLLTAPP
jgi:hypothetical protein